MTLLIRNILSLQLYYFETFCSKMIIDNNFDSASVSTNAREFKHVIDALLYCDLKVKKNVRRINLYEIVTANDVIDALVLLSKEEILSLHLQSGRLVLPRFSKIEISDTHSM